MSDPRLVRVGSTDAVTHPARSRQRLCLALAGLGLLACLAASAAADPIDVRLGAARERMDAVQREIAGDASLDALARGRDDAIAIGEETSRIAATLAPSLANVDARLAELGPAPSVSEPDGIAAQRRGLAEQHDLLGSQVKLARLLAIEGEQAVEQIARQRRSRWTSQLGERTRSVLGAAFWSELAQGWSRDRGAVARLGRQLATAADATGLGIWLLMLALVAVAIAAAFALRRMLLALASQRVPHGRIRRSLVALGSTLIAVGAAFVGTHVVRWGLLVEGSSGPELAATLKTIADSATFGTFVAGLGRALMSPNRPSWRLPPIPDPVADQLRHEPVLLGIVIAFGATCDALAGSVGAGGATTMAIDTLFSIALSLVIVMALQRGEQLRHRMLASATETPMPPRPFGLLVVVVLSWSLLTISVVCILFGYVALGSFMVKQTTWGLIVVTSAYLLAAFADDACVAWLEVDDGADADAADGDRPAVSPMRRQAAVLLSAALRIVVGLVAIAAVFGPLEQGASEIVQRAQHLPDGIAIGEIRILPAAVLESIAVLLIGYFVVRTFQRWFLERFLPTTTMDAGMRSSTTTLLGYLGVVIVFALSLSALGIGLERVAWVASALSVGIGFGLQAVVSNFVSGLILLTERPVKVGDLVSLGGVEGDIRRINVRATEIQMGDRSTVIVPNTEFITKVVRNVTHASPLGLVQIKLPLPFETDVERVRAIALSVMAGNKAVVDNPAPNVQLDGIDAASLLMVITGSVGSPRQIGGVRSDLLFAILSRMRAEGLSLARPAVLFRDPPETPTAKESADD